MVVKGAALANGLLTVELKRELPEALKPRSIEIATGSTLNEGKVETKAKKAA